MARIDDVIKTKFTNDKHRFVTNMIYTANWIQNSFNEFLKPFGISNQQFNILRILKGAGDWVAMNDIKNLMIEKSPNATRLADKLLNKELIERERSATDRRVVYLQITQKGLDLLNEIEDKDKGVVEEMLGRITDREAKQASKIIDKLRG